MGLFNLKDLLLISPALTLTGAGLLVLFFQVILPKFRLWFSYWVAVLAAVFVSLLILVNLPHGIEFLEPFKFLENSKDTAFKDQISWNPYNALFSLSLSFSTLLILLLSRRALIHLNLNFSEAYQMLLFSSAGLIFFILSNHLIVMFISLELASLPIFVLAGWHRKLKSSNEAGMKYFLLSVFSIAFFLLGIAFVYGSLGTIDLIHISKTASNSDSILINPSYLTTGIFLILFSLAFKVALFPLHAWVPDVYEGSITIVTAFMASLVKIASVAVMFKVLHHFSHFIVSDLLDAKQFFYQTLVWLAICSMFYGNISALVQTNLKRIFAYSSISHAGYMAALFWLAANADAKEYLSDASASLWFYVFSYSITTVLVFGVIAYLEEFLKIKKNTGVQLEDIKNLSTKKPFAAFLISAASLSFAGIPPLVGFYAKFYLLKTLLLAKMYWLAFFISINSLIAVYYYARIFFYSYYFDNERSEYLVGRPQLWKGLDPKASILVLASIILLLGIFSPPSY